MSTTNIRPLHRLITRLLSFFYTKDEAKFILLDLNEGYHEWVQYKGVTSARMWLMLQLLKIVQGKLINMIWGRLPMIWNFIKIAFRSIGRQKVLSFLNIFGLATAMAACILIILFVVDEVSYDNFHEHKERLFRMMRRDYEATTGDISNQMEFLPPAMGPELARVYEDIEAMSRHMWETGVVRYGDKIFRESVQMVDAPFFTMFSYHLINGDKTTVLADDANVVMTRAMAEKYFGLENPIGKLLTMTFGQTTKDFLVTGVAEDPPPNASLQFDFVIPISNLDMVTNNPGILQNWRRWYFPFYVLLKPGVSVTQMEEQFRSFCKTHFSEVISHYTPDGAYPHGLPFDFALQPIQNVYIDSQGIMPSVILVSIALIILLIACVNFTNISIGLSAIRIREVGIRKVMGAQRTELIQQFWGEAIFMSTLAAGIGVLLAASLLPRFNALSGKTISFSELYQGAQILAIPLLAIITGLLAGSYPAVILSRQKPVEVLKNKIHFGTRSWFTRALVVFQFTLSAILIISAMVLGNHAKYLIHRGLGYEQEGLLVIRTQENDQVASEYLFRKFTQLATLLPGVKSMSASNREFGIFLPTMSLHEYDPDLYYHYNRVDPNFVSTIGLQIAKGRDFRAGAQADMDAVLINESFMKRLGPDFEVGSLLNTASAKFPYHCRVIGVLADFHFRSLRSEIAPLLLYVGKGFSPARDRFSRMFVRVDTHELQRTLRNLENIWKEVQPDKPFVFYFQDDRLKRLYQREAQWSQIVTASSVMSMIIACLGVIGLTAVMLSRRVKEIGIRKVLGAKIIHVGRLILGEFVVLIIIANVIAWPVTFLILRSVMQNYPYRAGISPYQFLFTGFIIVITAILTILLQTYRAATANPVDALRNE